MMTMNELLNMAQASKDWDDFKAKLKEWRANRPAFEGGGGGQRILRRRERDDD
jgi:hypothetical protein